MAKPSAVRALGKRIRAAREARKLSMQHVADVTGRKHRQTVATWEDGTSQPKATEVPVLADELGLTCDELLRGRS
jgi:transcriptional regulator with XRE-family HTH domain